MEFRENLGRSDYVVLASIWVFFIIRCLFTGGEVMWFDEIFSFRMIHDPSVRHMLHALGDQADGAPPVYYLTAKAWSAVFSGSPLSLRLFSTVAFCAGFTLLWWTLRRAFKFIPTVFAFALILGHNKTIAFEASNLRFYGLLFALVSLTAFLGIRLCQSERPGRGLLLANLLTNAALVLCHPLGGFYGAAIMFGVALSDFLSRPRRIRPLVFASYFGGWAAIFLWFKQFLHQADINNPYTWIPMPGYRKLFDEVHAQSDFFLLFLFFTFYGLIYKLTARFHRTPPPGVPFEPGRRYSEYLAIGLSLIGVLPFFWTFSRIFPTNSLFLPRYFIGVPIGWTMVLACFFTYVVDRRPVGSPLILKVLVAAFALFALHPLVIPTLQEFLGDSEQDAQHSEYLAGISDPAFGHPELPIVCPDFLSYVVRNHYSPDAARYYYLLDWQAATSPKLRLSGATVAYKLLSAVKRNYPDTANIMDASEFLRRHPVFLLQDVPKIPWASLYLKPGTYKITRLEPDRPLGYDHLGEWRLVLVEKQP